MRAYLTEFVRGLFAVDEWEEPNLIWNVLLTFPFKYVYCGCLLPWQEIQLQKANHVMLDLFLY